VSQLVDADGEIKTQWIKSERSKEDRLQVFTEAVRDMLEPYRARAHEVPAPAPALLQEDLVNVLPVGDAHVGLFSWWAETGENFDLKIAGSMYRTAYDQIFAAAPKASTLLLVSVGDYFHSDGAKNATTKGTPVDVDGRWPKVLREGLDLMRYAIELGLRTHETVIVVPAGGNHDAEATITMAIALCYLYEGNPRVVVEDLPRKHHYYRFGRCLLGVTHGDTGKPADLPSVMACDRPQDWGETEHRHWYTGHVHHDTVKEYRGATVESVRVLPPSDAWHKGQGYRSGRDLKLDTWHKDYGKDGRIVIGIRRIQEMMK
jgi:hypothetical protein